MDLTKSVVLCNDKCNGCDRCMKRCPTEAIRVRDGKAVILYERCVGCGECVRVCPTHAKTEIFDPFENIKRYKYKVALPSPSIFGQFEGIADVNYVLTALKRIGFDDVFEVSLAVDVLADAYAKFFRSKDGKKPIISSACPAVKNLILMRYDYLIDHISPFSQPEAIAAELALERAMAKTGLPREDIGILVISQCAANVIELHKNYADIVDEVFGFKEIYFALLAEIKKLTPNDVEDISRANWSGIISGSSTGEAINLGTDRLLTASGVENVKSVLNELEKDKLGSLDFIELYACTTGCTGGSMNMENCFIARMRLRQLKKNIKKHKKTYKFKSYERFLHPEYKPSDALSFSPDRLEALKKMMQVTEILSKLPKLDCGGCGAPTCRAYAEDKAMGIESACRYVKE